ELLIWLLSIASFCGSFLLAQSHFTVHFHLSVRDDLTRCGMGAGEIWITPSKGISSSTESAASITATMTVAFGGANRTALMKMIASQEMRTISMGRDMEVSVCSNSNQRI